MAKRKRTETGSRQKPAKKTGGPFLAAAVFCEGILEDQAGRISPSWIIDGINVTLSNLAPPDMPSKERPVIINQSILIILRSGDSPGKHRLQLVMQQPNGKRSEIMEKEIELSEPPHGGCNVKSTASLHVFSSGLFLIDVFLDGKRFTRMPINISIQRTDALPTAASPGTAGDKRSRKGK